MERMNCGWRCQRGPGTERETQEHKNSQEGALDQHGWECKGKGEPPKGGVIIVGRDDPAQRIRNGKVPPETWQ